VAAGVLNSARQTGSVIGVALFGSFIGSSDTFMVGVRIALLISAVLLLAAAAAILATRLRGLIGAARQPALKLMTRKHR
jgi:DHA2 family methylenomycin A resistance protein-like MFS transporter